MAKSGPDKSAPNEHVSGQSNKPMSRPAHALTHQQVAAELSADALDGLTPDEAKSRLTEYGSNDLGEAEGVQPLKIVIAQVANAMTMVSSTPRICSEETNWRH
jgi:magnesium-transporting ATPase (P-type)